MVRRCQRGFTLIEVLVALAIVGVALAASVRALGVGVTGVRHMQERSLAQQAAQNFLAELRLQAIFPPLGRRTQPCPQGTLAFRCLLTIAPGRCVRTPCDWRMCSRRHRPKPGPAVSRSYGSMTPRVTGFPGSLVS